MGVINYTTAKINELLDKIDKAPEKIENGKTPVFVTGTTTTLDPGLSATAEVVQDGVDENGNPKYKINFGVPKGLDGTSGGGTADSVQWTKVLNKPSWVNSATKPTYTASEVGALPVGTFIPSKVSELTNDSNFLTSANLKTINGESIVGSGNISISGTGGITEAPKDGKTYGRNNGLWVVTSQMDEAPSDGNAYARKNKGWATVLEKTETALLDNYLKQDSYTAIEPTDSINSAIGKLEAGLNSQSGGSSSDGIYYLPSSVLELTSTSTSEQIVEAFGGSDKKQELKNAISENKKIYIQGNGTYGITPVYSYNLLGISLYVVFIRSYPRLEIVQVTFSISSFCSVYIVNGYSISYKINKLTNDSTSEEISSIFGGLSQIKELEKAIKDGNMIYTKLDDTSTSRMILSITIQNDGSKYYIAVSGVSGDSYLSSYPIGHLYITYDIASNTFDCQKFINNLS